MSTQPIGAGNPPVNITGLSSGVNTAELIRGLMAAERAPVAQLSNQQTRLEAEQTQLRQLQGSLQQLAFSAADLASPALFESSQTVTSSNPNQITALSTLGAGVGGYEVNVTQLANSAQRTFTFTSPASADTIAIDGHEIAVKAGASAQELVNAINSDASATVYAAALENGTVVLSDRATGSTGEGFIAVADPGGALSEVAGAAKAGRDAEFTVDGVAGSSSSNTVKDAIPGVTLTLAAVTSTSGPVTINVAAPAPNPNAITSQVESFVKLYNSTIAAIHTQVTTKPPTAPAGAGELGTGTLFGDEDLASLVNEMRQALYTPVAGLPVEMSSLADIGVGTGAASGAATPAQGAIEGELKVDSSALSKAIATNPAGVEKMLQSWAQGFQKLVDVAAEPGGTLDVRITGDTTRTTELSEQILSMNELLAVREKTLKSQFLAMEAAISQSQAQGSWLSGQITALEANSVAGLAVGGSSGH